MLNELGKRAKKASLELAKLDSLKKNEALKTMAQNLQASFEEILKENQKDILQAKKDEISEVLIKRLTLSKEKIFSMSKDILNIALLNDPIAKVDKMWKNEDGLLIGKKRVPLGVIGLIYESRPNVTSDASAICFKSSNAVILRGGKEAINTNKILVSLLRQALAKHNINQDAILLIENSSKELAREFMNLNEFIDVLIPRGSQKLINYVMQNSSIPVIQTGSGNCHIYVDKDADLKMAKDIIINAKTQNPSVCNSLETLVLHQDIVKEFLEDFKKDVKQLKLELRADEQAYKFLKDAKLATKQDWEEEFLDYILAIKTVENLDEAIKHINFYSSKHSESIISNNYFACEKFLDEIDSACVYVNASTRFSDGERFGFGAEIGISTQKLHARGPMSLEEMTCTKYIIYGQGQSRK